MLVIDNSANLTDVKLNSIKVFTSENWNNITYADLDTIGYNYTNDSTSNSIYFIYNPQNKKLGYITNSYTYLIEEDHLIESKYETNSEFVFTYCTNAKGGATGLTLRLIAANQSSFAIAEPDINGLNKPLSGSNDEKEKITPTLYNYTSAYPFEAFSSGVYIFNNDVSTAYLSKDRDFFTNFFGVSDTTMFIGGIQLQKIDTSGETKNYWIDMTKKLNSLISIDNIKHTRLCYIAATPRVDSSIGIDGFILVAPTNSNLDSWVIIYKDFNESWNRIYMKSSFSEIEDGTFIYTRRPNSNILSRIDCFYAQHVSDNKLSLGWFSLEQKITAVNVMEHLYPSLNGNQNLQGTNAKFIRIQGVNDKFYIFTIDSNTTENKNVLFVYMIDTRLNIRGEGQITLPTPYPRDSYKKITSAVVSDVTAFNDLSVMLCLTTDLSESTMSADIFHISIKMKKHKIEIHTINTTSIVISPNN